MNSERENSYVRGKRLRAASRAKSAASWRRHMGDLANRARHMNRKLKRKFGITLADYDEMLEDQGGGCAICGKSPEENGRRLAVDHNHETDEVRGLLCSTCNTGIGMLQDSSELCRLAAWYLAANSASEDKEVQ